MELAYDVYARLFDANYNGGFEYAKKTAEAMGVSGEQLALIFGDACRNTSIADYVWLPLQFEEPDEEHPEGMVTIRWRDEWTVEEYA